MFRLSTVTERFDGVLCLWQSFGYGDSDQNRNLLADMGRVVRPGGRILLDVFFLQRRRGAGLPDAEKQERGGRIVRTTRTRSGHRLRVELEYSDHDDRDVHDWQVYSPSELEDLGTEVGLDVIVRCAWFDPGIPPGRAHLRMQYLFEGRGRSQARGSG